MLAINQKQQKILLFLLGGGSFSSSAIYSELQTAGDEQSLVTLKRTLSEMAKRGLLAVQGAGPSTAYEISPLGRLVADVDAKAYCAVEPDMRYGLSAYNFDLWNAIPLDIFSTAENQKIAEATLEYRKRTADISPTIQKKELERLIIELSWKSSKIEGNTYTLLDTEKLLLEGTEAIGHSKEEAVMIVNHKNAFTFIHENKPLFKVFSRHAMEEVHALLVKDLNVGVGLRKKPVGILGSKYKPLDNIHQITDAVESLTYAVSKMESPYAKALIALIGISYIQPFEDGNKRASRLMANALLMAHDSAPLSYRSVDENQYREAMLVFYELNAVNPIKNIFIEQYDFAARNYAVI
jgi:fido (protein-threonine AMPylation protein)